MIRVQSKNGGGIYAMRNKELSSDKAAAKHYEISIIQ